MLCNHCTYKNEPDAKFCANCGNPLKKEHKPIEQNQAKSDPSIEQENQKGKSKRGVGIVLIILIILGIYLLSDNSFSQNDDMIYEDTKNILIDELEEKDIIIIDISPKSLTDIERQKDRESGGEAIYYVSGKVYDDYDQTAHYGITIVYDGDEVVNYEWEVDPIE